MNDEAAITNLLYRYAELIDAGDFAAAAQLFRYATLTSRDAQGDYYQSDHEQLLQRWRELIKGYPSGRPETKHLVTNPIVEVEGDAATARSYYTVLQQLGESPVNVLASGRYHDRFERVDGAWRFTHRDYTLMDLRGDLSSHLELSRFRARDRSK